jgi:hypothetical protein
VRRRQRAGPAVPEELARFVASEWPGCPHEALDAWTEACAAWLAADTTRLPRPGAGLWWLAGGSRRVLPFGDAIDVLRESGRYRKGMPPCPGEARPGSFTERGKGGEIIRHIEY